MAAVVGAMTPEATPPDHSGSGQATPQPPLQAALARVGEAAHLLGLDDVADQAAEAGRRLAGLTLEVAVVGEFKRGKSTLINALLGSDVLPAGVLPLTAVPTVLERLELECGDPVLRVAFADGRVEDHQLDELAAFVTEEGNPGNRLGVQRVVARLHAPLLDQGVRLVDTPGVGSVLEHNTAATDAYLPSLDAAILVTSADPPISQGERAFLERVAEHAVRLFVVLNKADYLQAEELERTVSFTEQVVGQVVARAGSSWPGPVYALSARAGVGDPDRFARFAADLRRFLSEGRAAAVADAAARSARRAAGMLRLALELERRAAGLPAVEIARRLQIFDAAAAALGDEGAADEALLSGAVRRALDALDAVVEPQLVRLGRAAAHATRRAADQHPDLAPGALLEWLEAERPALLEQRTGPLVSEARAAALAAWQRASGPVIERARQRLARLHAEAASAFGVPLPAFAAPDIDAAVKPIGFGAPRITHLADELASAAWRLRGRAAARARTITKAQQAAVEDTDAVFGRLRGAASLALGEAARLLTGQLRRHQQELAASLRAAVDRGGALLEAAEQDRAARQADLDQAAKLLDEADAALATRDQVQDGGAGEG